CGGTCPTWAIVLKCIRRWGPLGLVLCVLVKIKLHDMREADYPALHHMSQSACAELTDQDNLVWNGTSIERLGALLLFNLPTYNVEHFGSVDVHTSCLAGEMNIVKILTNAETAHPSISTPKRRNFS
ncbi:hypothetical protein M513_05620, partial [Trichuris suis]